MLTMVVDHFVKIGNELNGGPALADEDKFGRAIANLGDLNGDGVVDVAVGSTRDDSGGNQRGAIQILLLNTDGTVQHSTKIASNQNGGPKLENNDYFGRAIASLGDLDGDGVIDLAVGADGDDTNGNNRGAIYLLFLNSDGSVKSRKKIASDFNGGPSLSDGDEFGRSVANLGDIDGDGVTDLAVGARGDDRGGADRGAIYILRLNSDGTVKKRTKIAHQLNGGPELADQAHFGRSVAAIGDLDGDGTGELAVGAFANGMGTVHVLLMNGDASVKERILHTGPGAFGSSIAGEYDLDKDGIYDLVIGANQDSAIGSERGAVHISLLNNDGTLKYSSKIVSGTLTGSGLLDLSDGDNLGRSLATLGDIDSDGMVEIAIGAHFDDTGGTNRGAIYIASLTPGAAIEGAVYIDANGDGTRADEAGLSGVTVYLDINKNAVRDAEEPYSISSSDNLETTDVNEAGFFSFQSLFPGRYLVRQEIPRGVTQTEPNNPDEGHEITVSPGQIYTDLNFGIKGTNPTLAVRPSITLREDFDKQFISYNVTDGGEGKQAIRVITSSEQASVLPNPSVTYFEGDLGEGYGFIELESNENQYGSGNLTITVQDSGLDGTFDTPDDGFTTQQLLVEIQPRNDLPTLDSAASLSLAPVHENRGTPVGPVGTSVADLIDEEGSHKNFADVDGDLAGLAISNVNLQGGVLWLSTDGGQNWTPTQEISERQPLLLSGDTQTRLYYQPSPDTYGEITDLLTIAAWDGNYEWREQSDSRSLIGDQDGDGFGFSLALSGDGKTLVTGNTAEVAVAYHWDSTSNTWQQRGGDLASSGDAIALSDDGLTIALQNEASNEVVIYRWSEGESQWDQSFAISMGELSHGQEFTLSGDGKTLSLSGYSTEGQPTAIVYRQEQQADNWKKLGQSFTREVSIFQGPYVGVNFDGTTLALGWPYNFDADDFTSTNLEIFDWDESQGTWTQRGNGISGAELGIDFYEFSWQYTHGIALSADGNHLAFSGNYVVNPGDWDARTEYHGYAAVFSWLNGAWEKQGQHIDDWVSPAGEHEYYNTRIAISTDGSIISFSAVDEDNPSGYAAAYQWNPVDQSWKPVGNERQGIGYFGASSAMSADGTTLAVGDPQWGYYDFISGETVDAGKGLVKVFHQSPSISTETDTVGINVVPGPTIDPIPSTTIDENTPELIVALTGVSAGEDPTQPFVVSAVSSKPELIPHPRVIYSSPNTPELLKIWPSRNLSGTATITVTVENGGFDNDLSTRFDNGITTESFDVYVTQTNDLPTLAKLDRVILERDANRQTIQLSGLTAGTGETQPVRVTALSSNTSVIPHPEVTYKYPDTEGTLVFQPVADKAGVSTITVVVEDGGLDGDLTTSEDNATSEQEFMVYLDVRPSDAPLFYVEYEIRHEEWGYNGIACPRCMVWDAIHSDGSEIIAIEETHAYEYTRYTMGPPQGQSTFSLATAVSGDGRSLSYNLIYDLASSSSGLRTHYWSHWATLRLEATLYARVSRSAVIDRTYEGSTRNASGHDGTEHGSNYATSTYWGNWDDDLNEVKASGKYTFNGAEYRRIRSENVAGEVTYGSKATMPGFLGTPTILPYWFFNELTHESTLTYTIRNQAPVAVAESSAYTLGLGKTAYFYGQKSYDPDQYETENGILLYEWYVRKPGSEEETLFGTGHTLPFIPNEVGTYEFRLVVTDDEGSQAVDEFSVDVDLEYLNVVIHGWAPLESDLPDTQHTFLGYATNLYDTANVQELGISKHDFDSVSVNWDSRTGFTEEIAFTILKLAAPLLKYNPTMRPYWRLVNYAVNIAFEHYSNQAKAQAELAAQTTAEKVRLMVEPYGYDPSTSHAINLIGHSRGGYVASRTSQLLWQRYGINTCSLVTLDGFASDWPFPADAIGDGDIAQSAIAMKRQNYRVQDSLLQIGTFDDWLADKIAGFLNTILDSGIIPNPNPISSEDVKKTIDWLIESFADWKAPPRGFEVDQILLDPNALERTNHINVHDLYFDPNQPALSESPWNDPSACVPQIDSGNDAEGEMPKFNDSLELQPLSQNTLQELWSIQTIFGQSENIFASSLSDIESWMDSLIAVMAHPGRIEESVLNATNARLVNIGSQVGLAFGDIASANVISQLQNDTNTLNVRLDPSSLSADSQLKITIDNVVVVDMNSADLAEHSQGFSILFDSESQRVAEISIDASSITLMNLDLKPESTVYRMVSPDRSAANGESITLRVLRERAEPFEARTISIYRESNGIEGLQIGTIGDTLVTSSTWHQGDSFEHDTLVEYQGNSSTTFYASINADGVITDSNELTFSNTEFDERSWLTNHRRPQDVNRDTSVTALDALIVINLLNRRGGNQGAIRVDTFDSNNQLYDVNADRFITPLDALIVINYLNRRAAGGGGEGESVTSNLWELSETQYLSSHETVTELTTKWRPDWSDNAVAVERRRHFEAREAEPVPSQPYRTVDDQRISEIDRSLLEIDDWNYFEIEKELTQIDLS